MRTVENPIGHRPTDARLIDKTPPLIISNKHTVDKVKRNATVELYQYMIMRLALTLLLRGPLKDNTKFPPFPSMLEIMTVFNPRGEILK